MDTKVYRAQNDETQECIFSEVVEILSWKFHAMALENISVRMKKNIYASHKDSGTMGLEIFAQKSLTYYIWASETRTFFYNRDV